DVYNIRTLAENRLASRVWRAFRLHLRLAELLGFRGSRERRDGRGPARDYLRDQVEVAGSYEALVFDRFVTVMLLAAEFFLLQTRIGRHPRQAICPRQFEHAEIQRVETCQGDELELVPHRRQFGLELRDDGIVQFGLPVKRWRAVVGQQFAGIVLMYALGELSRFLKVGMRGFAPKQVSIGGVRNCACNGGLQSAADAEKALRRPLAGEELTVARIDVA